MSPTSQKMVHEALYLSVTDDAWQETVRGYLMQREHRAEALARAA